MLLLRIIHYAGQRRTTMKDSEEIECVRWREWGGSASLALPRRYNDVETTKIMWVTGDWQFPPGAVIHISCRTAENCFSFRLPAATLKIDFVNATQWALPSECEGWGLKMYHSCLNLFTRAGLSSQDKRSGRCWLDGGMSEGKVILYY